MAKYQTLPLPEDTQHHALSTINRWRKRPTQAYLNLFDEDGQDDIFLIMEESLIETLVPGSADTEGPEECYLPTPGRCLWTLWDLTRLRDMDVSWSLATRRFSFDPTDSRSLTPRQAHGLTLTKLSEFHRILVEVAKAADIPQDVVPYPTLATALSTMTYGDDLDRQLPLDEYRLMPRVHPKLGATLTVAQRYCETVSQRDQPLNQAVRDHTLFEIDLGARLNQTRDDVIEATERQVRKVMSRVQREGEMHQRHALDHKDFQADHIPVTYRQLEAILHLLRDPAVYDMAVRTYVMGYWSFEPLRRPGNSDPDDIARVLLLRSMLREVFQRQSSSRMLNGATLLAISYTTAIPVTVFLRQAVRDLERRRMTYITEVDFLTIEDYLRRVEYPTYARMAGPMAERLSVKVAEMLNQVADIRADFSAAFETANPSDQYTLRRAMSGSLELVEWTGDDELSD